MFAVRAPVLCVPLNALVPVHPPAAVQVVEFVDVHFSCEDAPDATLVGEAVNVTAGHGSTCLPTFFVTVPPSPDAGQAKGYQRIRGVSDRDSRNRRAVS